MAEYHIGCGITAIFAGTLNKNKTMWRTKSPCTDEAIEAVRDYIVQNELGGLDSKKQSAGYAWKLKDGRTLELVVRVCDNPEPPGKRRVATETCLFCGQEIPGKEGQND